MALVIGSSGKGHALLQALRSEFLIVQLMSRIAQDHFLIIALSVSNPRVVWNMGVQRNNEQAWPETEGVQGGTCSTERVFIAHIEAALQHARLGDCHSVQKAGQRM